MEDLNPKTQHRRRQRKKRGASDDIVGRPPGHGLRDASQPPDGTVTVEPGPPVPSDPADVLALLRSEIEEKYGAKACGRMPLSLSKKSSGMVRNSILNRYAPQVVVGMVRVLVWDWEVARSTCFPYKAQVKIPTVESLCQYQETLATAIDTGLNYDGAARGKWKTYYRRYLEDANPSESGDPF